MATRRSQDDVRYRLSAEGIDEVVNAFRRVQREAEKSGKGTTQAFAGLKQVGANVQRGILAIAAVVTAAAAGFTLLAKRALDSADAVGKLEQKTGITVETLSTLSFAARTAALDQEQLEAALIRFARSMDDYDRGTRAARDATQQLFGSSKALEGLDTDTRLLKTFEALGKVEAGAKRTALAIQFFGRSGAELLPLVDDLAQKGFDNLRQEAHRLGLVISRDLVEAATRAKDAMANLQGLAEGVAAQFLAGFLPALTRIAEGIVDLEHEGVESFERLGKSAGRNLGFALAVIAAFFREAADLVVGAGVVFTNFGTYLKQVFTLQWKGSFRDLTKNTVASFEEMIEAKEKFYDQLVDLFGLIDEPRTPRGRRPGAGGTSEDLAALERAARARRALQEQLLDNELNLLKAQLQAQGEEERRRFADGLMDLADYYARRRAIVEREAAKELAVLERRPEAERTRELGRGETEEERAKAVAAIEGQIAVRRIQLASRLAALTGEYRNETRKLHEQVLEFETKLRAMQGDRFAASRAALDAEIVQYDEILRKQGVADEERRRRLRAFSAAGEAGISFDQVVAEGRQALAQLAADRQAIDQQVQQGLLFSFQGEERIMALERERLPLLQRIAQAQLAAAEATGDPEKIAQAREFAAAINEIAVSSDAAARKSADLKAALESALTSNLLSFFDQGVKEAENFGDAMRALALSVVDSLRQIVTQMLVNLAVQRMLGAFGGAAGAAGGGLVTAGGVEGMAGGGLVRGPGTGTSDSIAARLGRKVIMLSNSEFVVRAAVVKEPGVLEFLKELNMSGTRVLRRRGVMGFAEGGLVVDGTPGSPGGGDATLFVGLEPELVLKKLSAGPAWTRAVLRVMADNPKQARTILGGRP
jgi:hypothetical protein